MCYSACVYCRVRGLFCEILCGYLKFHRAVQVSFSYFYLFICFKFIVKLRLANVTGLNFKVGDRSCNIVCTRSREENS